MTIPSNLNFELLGVLVLLLLTPALWWQGHHESVYYLTQKCRLDAAWTAVLVILHEFVWLFFTGKHACTYPTRCILTWDKVYQVFFIVCSRLSEPQWPLKIRRHGHFKEVFVLVIYHLVAFVELLAAILRVRTQERVCRPKCNTRTYKKLWALPNKGWGKKEKMNHAYIFTRYNIAVFFYP